VTNCGIKNTTKVRQYPHVRSG